MFVSSAVKELISMAKLLAGSFTATDPHAWL